MNAAMNRTLKRTMMRTRTEISSIIRKTYVVKAGDIKSTTFLRAVSRKPAEYELSYTGKRLSVRYYKAQKKRVKSKRGWRTGVTVKVRKDRGRKLIRGGFYAGGWPVYLRKGKGRTPIQKHSSLAIPQMAATKRTVSMAAKFMGKELDRQFTMAMKHSIKTHGAFS